MPDPPPPPAFTLRGHKAGVTALVHLAPSTIISADEKGNIAAWSQSTFKRLTIFEKACDSKILSLKLVELNLKERPTSVLVVQSREHGVHLIDCDKVLSGCHDGATVTSFLAYPSLFSRGDAIQTNSTHRESVLAYPSYLEVHMVTVRFIGDDGHNSISGSAARTDNTSPVFDICIREGDHPDKHRLFVAYEDGSIVIYNLDKNCSVEVPELNVEGLKMDILNKLDLNIGDFVSALDVREQTLVCGSPKKELLVVDLVDKSKIIIALDRPGTSNISIRPDGKLFAAAGWDHAVRLFSSKSRKHLATFKNHQKQISNILFVAKHSEDDATGDLETKTADYLMYCASLDGTISIFDVY